MNRDRIDQLSTTDLTAWIYRRANDYARLSRVCDLVYNYFQTRADPHKTLETIDRVLRGLPTDR